MLAGVYIVSVAVVSSAHEGVPLGRRLHTIWTPVRGALAIAFLAPLPGGTGLSLLQGGVLALVSLGIGAADALHGKAVDYQIEHAGSLQAPTIDNATAGLAASILRTEIAWRALRDENILRGDGPYRAPIWVTQDESGGYWLMRASNAGRADLDLGSIKVFCSYEQPGFLDSLVAKPRTGPPTITEDRLCDATMRAVIHLQSDLRPVARAIAWQLYGGENVEPPQVPDTTVSAIYDYLDRIERARVQALSAEGGAWRRAVERYGQDAKRQGWIATGLYYLMYQKQAQRLQSQVARQPVAVGASSDTVQKLSLRGERIAVLLDNSNSIINAAIARRLNVVTSSDGLKFAQSLAGGSSGGQGVDADSALSVATQTVADKVRSAGITDSIRRAVADGTNPILALQTAGNAMLTTGFSIAGATVALQAASSSVFGKLADLAAGASGALKALSPYLFMLVMALLIGGFTLAWYVPAVPFILWILEVIGWVILVFGMIVAAPLWALAHGLIDSDDHAIGSAAREGYKLALQVMLQPAVMVIAFIFASILIGPVVWLAGRGFGLFFEAPRRFEWNSPGNLCQITRKIRNEEPEWTATRYCFLGWV